MNRAGEASSVGYHEEYVVNSRGMKLFTCTWWPLHAASARALVFLCHGYGMDCSETMQETGVRLATCGYRVYGLEYEGHGKSQGLHGFIPDMDRLIHDCADFFLQVSEKEEYSHMKKFLLGESMGGAVALSIHKLQPNLWDGALLVAPMCKISDELKPHPLVISLLARLTRIIPTWKIVPTKDIFEVGYQDPAKRALMKENPVVYKGRPRLMSGHEILKKSIELEESMEDVTLPMLIIHGQDDVVTDPNISRALYDLSISTDKTLKLYPSMWHGLLCGETPFHTDLVFCDIINWLNQRSSI